MTRITASARLPLGGYVRMAGDNPVEERTGAAYEFLSRPRWQRCLIAIAGPVMNILLTFVVFMGVFWLVGIPTPSYFRQPADVVAVPHDASPTGVQTGDRIVQVNGVKTPTWRDVFTQAENAKPGDSLAVVVSRGGTEKDSHHPGAGAGVLTMICSAIPPCVLCSTKCSRARRRTRRDCSRATS